MTVQPASVHVCPAKTPVMLVRLVIDAQRVVLRIGDPCAALCQTRAYADSRKSLGLHSLIVAQLAMDSVSYDKARPSRLISSSEDSSNSGPGSAVRGFPIVIVNVVIQRCQRLPQSASSTPEDTKHCPPGFPRGRQSSPAGGVVSFVENSVAR